MNQPSADLKELFKQAAEIANHVPANMQEAAFNRALDLLVGGRRAMESRVGKPQSRSQPSPEGPREVADVESLLKSIDSTAYPYIRSTRSARDLSLSVLQLALDEYGIDGLTPVAIARILTEKFRISTTRQAVGMALMNAADLVDRIAEGRAYRYRIMGPGKEYLLAAASPPDGDRNAAKKGRKRRSRQQKRATPQSQSPISKKTADPSSAPKTQSTTKPASKRTSTNKVGPKAVLASLIETGFFSAPKTGPDVQAHVKNKRGFDLGTDQLRLAMLRLVRDGALERDVNDLGQYEYKRS